MPNRGKWLSKFMICGIRLWNIMYLLKNKVDLDMSLKRQSFRMIHIVITFLPNTCMQVCVLKGCVPYC